MPEIYMYYTRKDGSPSSRKVQATHIEGNIFLIDRQPYDRAMETWEFPPGTRVKCNRIIMGNEPVYFAVARAD